MLHALAEGLSDKEIAQKLQISNETQRAHVTKLLSKLGVHSRLEALVLAVRHGVVTIRQVFSAPTHQTYVSPVVTPPD